MEYYESVQRYLMMESKDRENKMMDQMEKYFVERTRQHISRVQDFIDVACEFFPQHEKELRERGKNHDASKFMIPERKWYVLLTWKYKLGREGKTYHISDKQQKHLNDTTFHHCKNNKHHPEYWCPRCQRGDNPVNKDNREKRDFMVDGSRMDDVSILEMVCDWSAMSKELGEPGPKKWADDSIRARWKFTDSQKNLIYETIDLLWK